MPRIAKLALQQVESPLELLYLAIACRRFSSQLLDERGVDFPTVFRVLGKIGKCRLQLLYQSLQLVQVWVGRGSLGGCAHSLIGAKGFQI